jgi:hypothetical protein
MNSLPDFLEGFHSSKWSEMDAGQRRHLLQDLENHVASEQGRQPRAIIAATIDNDSVCGYYNGVTPNLLTINEKHLSDEFAGDGYNYMCLDTVLHEGRHAFQDDAVEGKVANDPQQTKQWFENENGLYQDMDKNPAYYRFQPKESDAHDFGYAGTDQVHKALGSDPAYDKYLQIREGSDDQCKYVAEAMYGPDYKAEIAQEVHENYIERQALQEASPAESGNSSSEEASQDLSESQKQEPAVSRGYHR